MLKGLQTDQLPSYILLHLIWEPIPKQFFKEVSHEPARHWIMQLLWMVITDNVKDLPENFVWIPKTTSQLLFFFMCLYLTWHQFQRMPRFPKNNKKQNNERKKVRRKEGRRETKHESQKDMIQCFTKQSTPRRYSPPSPMIPTTKENELSVDSWLHDTFFQRVFPRILRLYSSLHFFLSGDSIL